MAAMIKYYIIHQQNQSKTNKKIEWNNKQETGRCVELRKGLLLIAISL